MACIVKELVDGRLRATGTGTATRDRFILIISATRYLNYHVMTRGWKPRLDL
jgi:hypothetical protein